MNRNQSIKGAIAVAACGALGMTLFHCSQPPGVIGAGGNGGAGGQGGSSTIPDDASVGGSTSGEDAAVTINLDVIPASWGPSDAPSIPDVPPAPTLDANCGIVTKETTRQPVDVLLVLDRSSSMSYSIEEDCSCSGGGFAGGGAQCSNTTNCVMRWDAIGTALDTTLSSTQYVDWGLKLFGSITGGSCNVTANPEVPIAADSAAAIQAEIASVSPGSYTPTAAAITAATAYLQSLTDPNKKFILLATDGDPNCGADSRNTTSSDLAGATAAVTAADQAGFPVYVIGIGPSVSNLTQLAQAGGTTDFYPATSPQELADALSSIGKAVGSCSYTFDQAPPDPNNVAVYVNKQQVAQDDNNGWKFGATTQDIELTGSYCDQITSGAVDTTVQILFGCEGAPPFPTVIK